MGAAALSDKKGFMGDSVKNMPDISGIKHIAIIMDGNGRWAKKRHMSRECGHSYGAKNFKKIVRYLGDIGIENVTVYAFSTENWKRPKKEVDEIMRLMREYVDQMKKEFEHEDVNIHFIGGREPFDTELRADMDYLERVTAGRKCRLCIAVNYGGRAEIVDAVNKLIASGKTEITEDDITENIYSGICPPPDIIIRTGNEYRLSNFLLWQLAYAELFFSPTLWPDFDKSEINSIIKEFHKRKRRFGGV